MKKRTLKKLTIYFYAFLLLALSGNPFFQIASNTAKFMFVGFVLLLAVKHHTFFNIKRASIYLKFVLFFVTIFIFQRLVLGSISVPSAIAFIAKITLGYIIIRYLGNNFKFAVFQVMFVISFISLFGYLWNFVGFDIPAIVSFERTDPYRDNSARNILLFHQNSAGARNSGMFWEPGVFACYINLAFLFYLGSIKSLLTHQRFKVFIILLALVTTYSTTGYIVLFLVAAITIYFEYSKKYGVLVVPIFLIFGLGAYFTYENTEFLKEKIDSQFNAASNRDEGEFAPDRLSALLFDLHYIAKHPLTGNGYDSNTRFADHPSLIGEELGHGNGFSDFLASMGVLSLLFYSFYIYKYNKHYPLLFLLGIFVLLQGEPLLNFPLFLSLPFVFIYERKNRRTVNVPQ